MLALQVATLDELSGGRAVLGAGLGGNRKEFEEFGESFDAECRWQLLEDGLGVIRGSGPARSGPVRSRSGSAATAPACRLAARYDGWLPDSTSLDEMTMSPDDVRDETQREIGVMGYSGAGQDDLHESYAQAGTTWWLEHVHDRRCSLDELQARVAAGP